MITFTDHGLQVLGLLSTSELKVLMVVLRKNSKKMKINRTDFLINNVKKSTWYVGLNGLIDKRVLTKLNEKKRYELNEDFIITPYHDSPCMGKV